MSPAVVNKWRQNGRDVLLRHSKKIVELYISKSFRLTMSLNVSWQPTFMENNTLIKVISPGRGGSCHSTGYSKVQVHIDQSMKGEQTPKYQQVALQVPFRDEYVKFTETLSMHVYIPDTRHTLLTFHLLQLLVCHQFYGEYQQFTKDQLTSLYSVQD